MGSTKKIRITEMYNDALTTAAAATESTKYIEINDMLSDGYFSAYVSVTGAGAILKLEYMVSFDGTNFYVPQTSAGAAVTDIVAAHTAVTGQMIYAVSPVIAPYVKVRMTVTGANASNVTVKIANQ